jgi:hypothetical protein
MADGGEHPLRLVLSSLVEDELHATRPESPSPRRRRAAVFEIESGTERLERVFVRVALDVRDVRLLDAVAWVRQMVSELPVVREQERPGRVRVEPPDRDDARLDRDELDHRGPPVRVACRRDDSGRLVQEDVREPLPLDRLAVHLDAVA